MHNSYMRNPYNPHTVCMEGNLRLKIDWASLILGRKFTGGFIFGGAYFRNLRYSVTTLQFLIEDGILWVYIPLTVHCALVVEGQSMSVPLNTAPPAPS